MPELPEAETLVRGLRPLIPGSTIRRLTIPHPDVLRAPERAFRKAARGRTITAVERRAKNVVMPLDGGAAYLVVNLGMTGSLIPRGFSGAAADRERTATHPAVRFGFDGGRGLVFNDVRRFGTVEILDPRSWSDRSGAIGPEPLSDDFTPAVLHEALQRSRSPLRNWLLDQKRVAGVGNIYASEGAFRAGVRPDRAARDVTAAEAVKLHAGLRDVLGLAIEHGGTTLQDYRDAEGRAGLFGTLLQVYGREGAPCVNCGTSVERVVLSNRSAFFCPACQS